MSKFWIIGTAAMGLFTSLATDSIVHPVQLDKPPSGQVDRSPPSPPPAVGVLKPSLPEPPRTRLGIATARTAAEEASLIGGFVRWLVSHELADVMLKCLKERRRCFKALKTCPDGWLECLSQALAEYHGEESDTGDLSPESAKRLAEALVQIIRELSPEDKERLLQSLPPLTQQASTRMEPERKQPPVVPPMLYKPHKQRLGAQTLPVRRKPDPKSATNIIATISPEQFDEVIFEATGRHKFFAYKDDHGRKRRELWLEIKWKNNAAWISAHYAERIFP